MNYHVNTKDEFVWKPRARESNRGITEALEYNKTAGKNGHCCARPAFAQAAKVQHVRKEHTESGTRAHECQCSQLQSQHLLEASSARSVAAETF